ncbi:MAG: type II secretion system protein [Planctomycetota bacterium]|nr:MAG: type II secretion system protein [Planctomycetota bacterium]
MPTRQTPLAFTLVETLVVLVIIAALAGMLMAGAQGLFASTQKVRTETIIETMRQAIEITATERGGPIVPGEHPLAGSFGSDHQPRALFQRSQDQGGQLLNSTSALTAPAIRGLQPSQVAAAYQDQLLLDSDHFADPGVPALYGLRRERIGLLAANLAASSHYHLLPPPPHSAQHHSAQTMEQLLSDDRFVVSSSDGPEANVALLSFVLGSTSARTELSKMDARSHLDDLEALVITSEDMGSMIWHDRVWTSGQGDQTANRWRPGFCQPPGGTTWYRYRIPGLAVYDAWGTEILYTLSRRNVVRLVSAGPSGAFSHHPGDSGLFNTPANSRDFSGDDWDASQDNIVLVTDDG